MVDIGGGKKEEEEEEERMWEGERGLYSRGGVGQTEFTTLSQRFHDREKALPPFFFYIGVLHYSRKLDPGG